MDHVSFPYRSSSHLVLLHVIAHSGSWEKHGLRVHYDEQISSSEAHRKIPAGEIEFVGGNHVSTYGHRARGDTWVYVGQTVNKVHTKLVVRADAGITGISDLPEKVVGTRGSHPSLNDWLQLKKRGLDTDRGDVVLQEQIGHKKGDMDPSTEAADKVEPLWCWVRDRKIDAAFLTPPSCLFAEEAGLKVIDIEPMPMIWFTTVSSSAQFVSKHPDLVRRFLRGMIEGIHVFKSQPERSIQIIQNYYAAEGQLNREQAAYTWHNLAPLLEAKLYPTMEAIANVFEEAKRQDKDAHRVNPMALWDLHHVRQLDDEGFAQSLGANAPAVRIGPEEQRESAKVMEAIKAAVKACGHNEGEECGCG